MLGCAAGQLCVHTASASAVREFTDSWDPQGEPFPGPCHLNSPHHPLLQVYKVVLDGVQLYAAKVLDLGLTDLHVQNIFLRVRKNERRNWLNE